MDVKNRKILGAAIISGIISWIVSPMFLYIMFKIAFATVMVCTLIFGIQFIRLWDKTKKPHHLFLTRSHACWWWIALTAALIFIYQNRQVFFEWIFHFGVIFVAINILWFIFQKIVEEAK